VITEIFNLAVNFNGWVKEVVDGHLMHEILHTKVAMVVDGHLTPEHEHGCSTYSILK
jgi:hypothetical protein